MNKWSALVLLIALISALDSAVVRQQRAANADASKPEPDNEKPGTVDSDKAKPDKSQGADTEGKDPEKPTESQEVEKDGPNPKKPTESQEVEEDGPNPEEPNKQESQEEEAEPKKSSLTEPNKLENPEVEQSEAKPQGQEKQETQDVEEPAPEGSNLPLFKPKTDALANGGPNSRDKRQGEAGGNTGGDGKKTDGKGGKNPKKAGKGKGDGATISLGDASVFLPDGKLGDTMCNYHLSKGKSMLLGPLENAPFVGAAFDFVVSAALPQMPHSGDENDKDKLAGPMCKADFGCDWGKCHPSVGKTSSTCCADGFVFICCKDVGSGGMCKMDVGLVQLNITLSCCQPEPAQLVQMEECQKAAKAKCSCGWFACVRKQGNGATACCAENTEFTCCKNPQIVHDNECRLANKSCKPCGWGECVPAEGRSPSPCCAEHYTFKCCEKPPPVKPAQLIQIDDCEKAAKSCGCGWYSCIPHPGQSSTPCCAQHYNFTCCVKAPPIKPPQIIQMDECEKAAKNCSCGWYNCIQKTGQSSTPCCAEHYQFTCCTDLPTTTTEMPTQWKELEECKKAERECKHGSAKCLPEFGQNAQSCCGENQKFTCLEPTYQWEEKKTTLLELFRKSTSKDCVVQSPNRTLFCACEGPFYTQNRPLIDNSQFFAAMDPFWSELPARIIGTCCMASEERKFHGDDGLLNADDISSHRSNCSCCEKEPTLLKISIKNKISDTPECRKMIEEMRNCTCPSQVDKRDDYYRDAKPVDFLPHSCVEEEGWPQTDCCPENTRVECCAFDETEAEGGRKSVVLKARIRNYGTPLNCLECDHKVLEARLMMKEIPLEKPVRQECNRAAEKCPCGFGTCVFTYQKAIPDYCCTGPYTFKCCDNVTTTTAPFQTTMAPKQITDKSKCNDKEEIRRVCESCEEYACVSKQGFVSTSACCTDNFQFQCCPNNQKPHPGSCKNETKKIMDICGCGTYWCRPNQGFRGFGCCPSDYEFVCCHVGKQTTSTTTRIPRVLPTTPKLVKIENDSPLFCELKKPCNPNLSGLAKFGRRFNAHKEKCAALIRQQQSAPSTELKLELRQGFMDDIMEGSFLIDYIRDH